MVLIPAFEQQLNRTTAQSFLIALSGGLDSTALLSLFAKQREKHPHFALRAIHIHHGLSPNADSWVQHCQALCDRFRIPLIVERVQVDRSKGIEAGAREARYQAIAKQILPHEVLVTAHHLNDQTETFFLALKRGSGLQGLSAMQRESELFGMKIFRPFLSFTREQLENYVIAEKLDVIFDESNADNRYERNFLRNQILPELHSRWPHFDHAVQRAAQHCFEQQQLIDELLNECFQAHCQRRNEFQLGNFTNYSTAKQTALLRRWLSENHSEMPSQRQLLQIIQDVVLSKADANPHFQLGDKVIRRYQNILHLTDKLRDLAEICLDFTESTLILPDNLGIISKQETENGILFSWQNYVVTLPKTSEPIQIRFRCAGNIKYHPKRPREIIKKIWQSLGVPPWLRHRIPLIFYGERLQSAVGFFSVFPDIEN